MHCTVCRLCAAKAGESQARAPRKAERYHVTKVPGQVATSSEATSHKHVNYLLFVHYIKSK